MALSLVFGSCLYVPGSSGRPAPLQRFYFPTYSRLSLFSGFSLPMPGHKSTGFRVVFRRTVSGHRRLARERSGRPQHSSRLQPVPDAFATWLQAEHLRRQIAGSSAAMAAHRLRDLLCFARRRRSTISTGNTTRKLEKVGCCEDPV